MKRSLLFYLLVVTTLVQSLSGQILIVHDGADTANFQSFLQSSGYTVDGDVLSDDPVLLEEGYLDSFNLVIYIRRGGSGSGSFPFTIELEESFELYLENGGHLFVTGSRSLSAAGGPRLAQLVRAFRLGSFSTVSPPDLQTSFDSHPILDGLYGNYVGTTFTGQFTQFDSINPDPASPDTVELITVESFDWGQISKFLYTDLPSGAGSVAYWNAGFPSAGGGGGGGGGNDEFSGGAETQNIFLNYLALVIAAEADAGEDLIVAENNGDGVISVILDASGSNSGAGEFISWDWTWPGGSASGERVEVVLPANGTPVEFALEMQNILSETFYDTRTITPYADAALYDDLVDAGNTNFGPTAQVAGDTIVALGGSPNTAVVYRCVAGVWSKEIVPISGADIRIIDENTFITGTLSGVIGNLHVYRWGGASWTESAITVTPSIDSQFVATNWVLHATDTDLILRADAEGTEKVLVYSWNGDSWQYVQELVPDGGFLPGYVGWGVHIGLDDDTLFISRNAIAAPEGEFFEYQIFEKSGATWTQQFRVTMARSSDLASDEFGFGGGLGVVSLNYYDAAINATYPILNAFRFGDGGLELPWYANRNDANPTTYEADINDFRAYRDVGGFSSIHVDSDSDAVVVGAGDDILFFSGNTWNPVPEGAKLRATDLIGLTNHFVADFADGLLLVGDDLGERVRVFDRHTDWALLNVEHAVDAGDPISGISSDGGEIPIYLNAVVDDPDGVATGYTFDWSWSGGGKADRQEDFVRVGPEVEEITLAVIDAQGVLIRDTLSVSIDTAPVIDAGPDHLVVDVDGDGQVNLLVEGALVEADVAITDWNWRWQGGTLTGQSGIVTLGFESHGEDLTLEAYDANGLASEAAFTFELLAMNVSPDILEAVRERDRSRLFYSEHVLLEGDELLLAGVSFSAPSCEEEECLGEGFDRVVPTSFTTSYYAELFRQGTVQTLLLEGSDDVRPILLQQGDVIGVDVSGSLSVFAATEGVNTQTAFASGFTYEGAAVGDGDLVAITGSAGSPPRSVRVYQHNDASWVQLLEIEPPTAADVDFGYRLAMCGDNLVVASEQSDTSHKLHIYSGLSGGGALTMVSVTVSAAVDALVCDAGEILFSHADSATVSNLLLDAATWLPGPGVTPDTPADGFGTSLSLGNDVLVVGDRDDDGAAVLFTRGPSGWGQVERIPWVQNSIYFPNVVSLDSYTLAVGYPTEAYFLPASEGNTSEFQVEIFETGKAYVWRNWAALAPNANFEPIAEAGLAINVSDTIVRDPITDEITEALGSEVVTLDGSASTDREDAIVSYEWTWEGGSASGETVNARFPVGTTEVTLTIMDEGNLLNTDTVSVTVVLNQQPPSDPLPDTSSNTLTVNLPDPDALWRLTSEFQWHASGEAIGDVTSGGIYQIEILPYPGANEVELAYVSAADGAISYTPVLTLPEAATETGLLSFPSTSQGFDWRLVGESTWRGTGSFILPTGDSLIEFKPVSGYATPYRRIVTISSSSTLSLNWGAYQRINNFDTNKIFDAAVAPDLESSPYQYVGMIRTPLGRGTGVIVDERVVLTAAHLFFDFEGLAWPEVEWFSRQQEGEYQAPPLAPRGILYRTSYAKLVAPDSVPGEVENLPDDDQEVDYAVLYFGSGDWDQGWSNFLVSTDDLNWLTGSESKHAVAYPQRSVSYPDRGKLFEKQFSEPLEPIDDNPLPLLYESEELFGDGGASGSPLFVQPDGTGSYYPAGILLAGQGRAVYRVIDNQVARMINDGKDAATGNDDVLDNSSTKVVYDGLAGFTQIGIEVTPPEISGDVTWSVLSDQGTGYSNLGPSQRIGYNSKWNSFTVTFNAVAGYAEPAPIVILGSEVTSGATTLVQASYQEATSTGYDQWKTTYSITDDEADDDMDGNEAIIEYAVDRDPSVSDYLAPVLPVSNPSQSTYAEFDVYVSATADAIRYDVKAADTLEDLINGTNTDTIASLSKADGSSGYLRVMDVQPVVDSSARFAWVEIVYDPNLSSP